LFLSNESLKTFVFILTKKKPIPTFSINDEDIPFIESVSLFGDDKVIVDETSSLENVENNARLTRCDCVLSA
jgi:hypothetical protein